MKKIISRKKALLYRIFKRCELRKLDICYTKDVEGVGIYVNDKLIYLKTTELSATYSQQSKLQILVKDLGYKDKHEQGDRISQFFSDFPKSFSGYIVN